jgi:hypothetical protein
MDIVPQSSAIRAHVISRKRSHKPAECIWWSSRSMITNDYHQRYERCDVSNETGRCQDGRLACEPGVMPVAVAV